jgi:HAD superfamily hydrolase (TIGR01493 family)
VAWFVVACTARGVPAQARCWTTERSARTLFVVDDTAPVVADGTAGDEPVGAVLFDLLMAVMDSPAVWSGAVHDDRRGLAWRDAVTARMVASGSYAPYEALVASAARELGLTARATSDLLADWRTMSPRPDSTAIARLAVPYAFVTNCSRDLATIAARRSGLLPRFTLSAEEAAWYKPDARIYRAACRRLDLPPGRVALVAGSVHDAEGGARAGLRSALVLRRPDQRAPEPPIRVVASLHEAVDWLEDVRRRPDR